MLVWRVLNFNDGDTTTELIDCLPWTIFRLDTSIPMSNEVPYEWATNAQVTNGRLFGIKRDDLMRIFGRGKAWELFFDFSGDYSYDDGSGTVTGSFHLNVNNDPLDPGMVTLSVPTTEEINLPHNTVFPDQQFDNFMAGGPDPRARGEFLYATKSTYTKEYILSPVFDTANTPDIYYWAPTDTYYIDLRIAVTFTVNDGGSPFIPLWDLIVFSGPADFFGPGAVFVGNFFWNQIEIPFYKTLRVDVGDPNTYITMDLMNFYVRPNPGDGFFPFTNADGDPVWDVATGVQLIDPIPVP